MIPCKTGNFILDRRRHQIVVGRMEFHLIDPHAITVKRLYLRSVFICLVCFFKNLCRSSDLAKQGQFFCSPAASFTFDTLPQGRITAPQILVTEVGRHVCDFMGRQVGKRIQWYHRSVFCSLSYFLIMSQKHIRVKRRKSTNLERRLLPKFLDRLPQNTERRLLPSSGLAL